MPFKKYPDQRPGIELLQRSLERGRLGHAYLFTGHQLEVLEDLAQTLAKTLNCQGPLQPGTVRLDSCDQCISCRKIDHATHPDVHVLRPESKSRIITVEQTRDVIREIQLKPAEAEYKFAIVVAADRMKAEAANAFLKTLEEPPAKSILVLLSTEPQRMLDTILSRCLRLNFSSDSMKPIDAPQRQWLDDFARTVAGEHKSLLGRYQLLDALLRQLTGIKGAIEKALTARSPLQQYKDADKDYIDRWEAELAAAIEAEYRRQRADVLSVLHWWLRDVWVRALSIHGAESRKHDHAAAPSERVWQQLLCFPEIPGTAAVAKRITTQAALQNLQTIESLQRWLGTNVQEALALEVGLLKLQL